MTKRAFSKVWTWAFGITSVIAITSGSSPAIAANKSSLLFINWSACVYKTSITLGTLRLCPSRQCCPLSTLCWFVLVTILPLLMMTSSPSFLLLRSSSFSFFPSSRSIGVKSGEMKILFHASLSFSVLESLRSCLFVEMSGNGISRGLVLSVIFLPSL